MGYSLQKFPKPSQIASFKKNSKKDTWGTFWGSQGENQTDLIYWTDIFEGQKVKTSLSV